MKRFLALLLLAGCGSKDEADVGPEGSGEPPLPNLVAPAAEDPAQLQARVEAALAAVLASPKDARYADVRSGTAGAACGKVDAKGARGKRTGFLPFVVTPDGTAIVSTRPGITFGDPTDPFPDQYIRWCATEEELANLGTAAFQAGSSVTNTIGMPELPAEPAPGAELPPAAPEAPPAAPPKAPPRNAAPPASAGDDSFFNAVIRDREAAAGKQD